MSDDALNAGEGSGMSRNAMSQINRANGQTPTILSGLMNFRWFAENA